MSLNPKGEYRFKEPILGPIDHEHAASIVSYVKLKGKARHIWEHIDRVRCRKIVSQESFARFIEPVNFEAMIDHISRVSAKWRTREWPGHAKTFVKNYYNKANKGLARPL